MFISFEGIDGSGKTTQFNLLIDYLNNLGIKNTSFREPGGTPCSEKIREILLDENIVMENFTEVFLFELARYELIKKIIKPELEKNNELKHAADKEISCQAQYNKTIIIADRFIDSTVAYQGFGRENNIDLITNMNHIFTFGIKPDITFYIKIDPDISKLRIKKLDRIDKKDDEFTKRVSKGFDYIAKSEPERVVVLDGSLDVQTIHDNIIDELKKRKIIT